VIRRNANVHAMAKVTEIATTQLSSIRKITRSIRKKVRPNMRIIGREVNTRWIYDWSSPQECM